jgi:hypothetical protein
MTLPPIDDWWSDLSADSQQAVLASSSKHLDEAVREEIREITGAVVGMIETLSDEDLDYARAHTDEND